MYNIVIPLRTGSSIYVELSCKIFDTDLSVAAATYIRWRLPGLRSRVAVTPSLHTQQPRSQFRWQYRKWIIHDLLPWLARPRPGLQENVGQWNKDVGTPHEKNGEQIHTHLATSSKRTPWVVKWSLDTNHSNCTCVGWGDSSFRYLAWLHLAHRNWPPEKEGRYEECQEQAGAQGVRAYMLFLWVYIFPFGLCFSFGFMYILWVLSYLGANVILILLRVWV